MALDSSCVTPLPPDPSFPLNEAQNAATSILPSLGSGEGNLPWKALQRDSQGVDKKIAVGKVLPGHTPQAGMAVCWTRRAT